MTDKYIKTEVSLVWQNGGNLAEKINKKLESIEGGGLDDLKIIDIKLTSEEDNGDGNTCAMIIYSYSASIK